MLRIAIQAKGRLNEDTMALLADAGISVAASKRKLVARAGGFPLEVLYLRDDDIPQAVQMGVADVLVLAGAERSEQHSIKLDYLQVTSGHGVRPVAAIHLDIAGEKFHAAAEGNGPVDAAINALKEIIKRKMVLREFTIQAINKGSDDVGKVHMQVEYDGHIYYGFGANTDIVTASVEAYIDCINKFRKAPTADDEL